MRRKFLIPLALAVGVLTLGHLTGIKNYQRVSADPDPELESAIEINSAFFTNWGDYTDPGTFGDKDAKFWDDWHFFNSLGSFFRGESNQGWTGTLTSRTWKQTTQYVYFTWSAANNTEDCKLIFHYGEHEVSMKNDTFVENPMMLRYFKIPDDDYQTLIAANPSGFDMSVDLYDNVTSGFGFHNFGYLHVNQTEEQVSDAMRYYLNSLDHDPGEWQVNKRKEIFNHYTVGNAGLKEVFYRQVSNIDDGFENNDDFLNHWYFDYNYFNGGNWGLRFDKAIGLDRFRPDDNTKMPFNKTGDGFFRGWHENEDLGGFVGGDNSIYRFVSRPFVLSGTGIVSIKMAGTASLHVIDPATRQDLAWADCQTFNTEGNQSNLMDGSFNTVTMVRHVINLEAYVGKKIQLAIADVSDGGWSALYADELDTTNVTYPAFLVDSFEQSNNTGTYNIYKADKYINSENKSGSNSNGVIYVDSDINRANNNAIFGHVDNSPAKDAYNFLNGYYASLRSPANEFNYANASAEAKADVVNAYLSLNTNARSIVNASSDILSATSTSTPISVPLAQLVSGYTARTVTFNANGGTGSMEPEQRLDGRSYKVPACSFTLSGKKFVEWNTANDGSGDSFDPEDEFALSADVTLYAIWVDTAVTTLEGTSSIAALRFHFSETIDGYTYTDVAIRFGAFISVSVWEDLKTEGTIEGYGIIVAETAYLTGTIKSNYEAAEGDGVDAKLAALCADSHIKKASRTGDTPELADEQQKSYMGVDEEYYIWQVRQNIDGNFATQYTSVAYIKFSGGIVFLNEITTSGKEMADAVLSRTNPSDPSRPALQFMKENF